MASSHHTLYFLCTPHQRYAALAPGRFIAERRWADILSEPRRRLPSVSCPVAKEVFKRIFPAGMHIGVINGQRARISRRLRGATSTPVRLLPSPRSRTAHARARIAMPNARGSCCSYCPDSAR